jgi:ADP-ribose pyrophosphatase YjhB (NUDIX family)
MNASGPNKRPDFSLSYAVAVLVVAPQGIPLIRDPKKPAPVFWKAPGGRSNANESAKSAAARELQEEIGVTVPEKDLAVVHEEDRGSHVLVLFTAKLKALPGLKTRGDEGEEIRLFTPKEILTMPDLFPNHRRVFEKILRGSPGVGLPTR